MSAWLADWRLALRLARRDALRAKGRSMLVLVMIALPVLAVTAADVVIATAQVDGVEGLDRRLGSAQALVTAQADSPHLEQLPDPDRGSTSDGGDRAPATQGRIGELLAGARLLPERSGTEAFRTDRGVAPLDVLEVDLTDPLTDGLIHLESGRLPRDEDEVVVNRALLDKGYAVGDPLELTDEDDGDGVADAADDPDAHAALPTPTIVGVAERTTSRTLPFAAGPLDSLGLSADGSDIHTSPTQLYLVGGPAVTWDRVKQLNQEGALVLSREVVEHPPPADQLYQDLDYGSGLDEATLTVLILVVVMALIEVVLLAGPAFAVGARRQQRSLALMAATGGTPQQARRVVLAGAVVLGGTAAAAGVVLGIGLGAAALPVVQRFSSDYLGPFDLRWLHFGGIAAFGLAAAFLAALVPAQIASRQDVVAVLAGRRGDRLTPLGSPLAGVLLLGLGVLGAAYGSQQVGSAGGIAIAASAILCVLAMILLVPLVLVGLSRAGRRLPLVVRYAVRDATRHRTRTVPAVAAVAATVAGVVALGIATSSDEAENRETYRPSVADGVGVVVGYGTPDWPSVERAVSGRLPDAEVTPVRGFVESPSDGYNDIVVTGRGLVVAGASTYGGSLLVSDGALPAGLLGLTPDTRAEATAALRAGRVVAFSTTDSPAREVRIAWHLYRGQAAEAKASGAQVLPATVVRQTSYGGPAAIVPTTLARRVRVPVAILGLTVSGASISKQEETDAREAATAVGASLTVERGYQPEDSAVIVQLVLAALGAVLMLGGTLTATFLALSDARPDLATLAAVGASPANRRGVAAAYALVVGLVGAVLGAAVGFVPGMAVSRTLTYLPGGLDGAGTSGPFYDVPWLLILGLMVLLPLLVAALVGLTARSRLPLSARLD